MTTRTRCACHPARHHHDPRAFVTHLLNDAGDAAWCGKRFNATNKIAVEVDSVTCNDCQRLAAAPVYERNRKEPRERARRIPFKQGRQFETRRQVEARS